MNMARSTGKKKSVGCRGTACSAAYRAPARRQLQGLQTGGRAVGVQVDVRRQRVGTEDQLRNDISED